jgi:hypothetical protein
MGRAPCSVLTGRCVIPIIRSSLDNMHRKGRRCELVHLTNVRGLRLEHHLFECSVCSAQRCLAYMWAILLSRHKHTCKHRMNSNVPCHIVIVIMHLHARLQEDFSWTMVYLLQTDQCFSSPSHQANPFMLSSILFTRTLRGLQRY